jgi:hypothetical protein
MPVAFRFAPGLKPTDETALLIFADGEVEVASGYSEDKTRLLEVLAGIEAYGKTALNDAVAVSPEYARKGRHEKKALLLVTDGIENDSQYSPAQAAEIAKKVDVPIYTMGYKLPRRAAARQAWRAPGSRQRESSRPGEFRAPQGKAFLNTPADQRRRWEGWRDGHRYILGCPRTRA